MKIKISPRFHLCLRLTLVALLDGVGGGPGVGGRREAVVADAGAVVLHGTRGAAHHEDAAHAEAGYRKDVPLRFPRLLNENFRTYPAAQDPAATPLRLVHSVVV